MTRKQFEDAQEAYSELHALGELHRQISLSEDGNILRSNISFYYGIGENDAISEMETVRLRHCSEFKKEAIEIIASKMAKVEDDLGKI